jgi:hypothetical protein
MWLSNYFLKPKISEEFVAEFLNVFLLPNKKNLKRTRSSRFDGSDFLAAAAVELRAVLQQG